MSKKQTTQQPVSLSNCTVTVNAGPDSSTVDALEILAQAAYENARAINAIAAALKGANNVTGIRIGGEE